MSQSDTPYRHSRRGLVWPFLIVGLLLVAWSVWWGVLVHRIEGEIAVRAEALRAAGYEVAYSDLATTGWPFRARVEARHVRLEAPSGHGVSAPVLVAEANAYRPDRWVLIAPDGLVLARGDKGKVAITAPAIRASASGFDQPTPRIAVELAEPVFTAHPGSEPFPFASAGAVLFEMRPTPVNVHAPQAPGEAGVLFRLLDARGRPDGPIDHLSGGAPFTLQAEAVVAYGGALRGAGPAMLAAWRDAGGRLTDVRGEMRAGESSALLSSDALSLDADGRLVGIVALEAREAAPALSGLGRGEAVDGRAAAAAAAAARVQEGLGGQARLTVEFRDGRTRIGPLDLAPAPKLF